MIKNKDRPLFIHKLMAPFLTIKKRTGTKPVPKSLGIGFNGTPCYIANSRQWITFNSIIQSV